MSVPATAARLALVLAAAAACGADPGVQAWRDGRFAEAHRHFSDAEAAAGASAPARVLRGRAVAALAVGDFADAEAAAGRLAGRDPGAAALRDFVHGNASWARSLAIEAEARRPGADAVTWDRSIAFAEAARSAWQRAAIAEGDDAAAARRNAERAELRLAALRERRPGPERVKGGPPKVRPRPVAKDPPPAPDRAGDPTREEARPDAADGDIPADAALRLLDRVAEREREKRDARRAAPKPDTGGTGKDW